MWAKLGSVPVLQVNFDRARRGMASGPLVEGEGRIDAVVPMPGRVEAVPAATPVLQAEAGRVPLRSIAVQPMVVEWLRPSGRGGGRFVKDSHTGASDALGRLCPTPQQTFSPTLDDNLCCNCECAKVMREGVM